MSQLMIDEICLVHGVPAKVGGMIKFKGELGKIIGATCGRLRIRLSDGTGITLHPTWKVEYLEDTDS